MVASGISNRSARGLSASICLTVEMFLRPSCFMSGDPWGNGGVAKFGVCDCYPVSATSQDNARNIFGYDSITDDATSCYVSLCLELKTVCGRSVVRAHPTVPAFTQLIYCHPQLPRHLCC